MARLSEDELGWLTSRVTEGQTQSDALRGLIDRVRQLETDLDAKLRLDGQRIGRDIAEWMRGATLEEAWNEGAHAGVDFKTDEPQVHTAAELDAFFALNPYKARE